jgi:hypothetical protein
MSTVCCNDEFSCSGNDVDDDDNDCDDFTSFRNDKFSDDKGAATTCCEDDFHFDGNDVDDDDNNNCGTVTAFFRDDKSCGDDHVNGNSSGDNVRDDFISVFDCKFDCGNEDEDGDDEATACCEDDVSGNSRNDCGDEATTCCKDDVCDKDCDDNDEAATRP